MKKIVSEFQTISILIILMLYGLIIVPTMIGVKPFAISSDSMEPQLKEGSVAYINTHVKLDDINIGEVIGVNSDEGEVTHRVVRINDDKSIVTKGDANEYEDFDLVTSENYVGKASFTIPYLGKVMLKSKTKIGVGIIVAFVSLNLLCIVFDREIYNEKIGKRIFRRKKVSRIEKKNIKNIEKYIESVDNTKENIENDDNTSKGFENDLASIIDELDDLELRENIEKKSELQVESKVDFKQVSKMMQKIKNSEARVKKSKHEL